LAGVTQIKKIVILLKIFAFNNKTPYLYICTMPIGISIINKLPPPSLCTAHELAARIEAYFTYIEGEFRLEEKPGKKAEGETGEMKKIWEREAEPATISGFAFFLGFNSRREFDDYDENGEFADVLKRGLLLIECMYEKRLQQQSSAGAIFVLKSIGWKDKSESKADNAEVFTTLEIKFIETGSKPTDCEQDVIL